MVQVSVSQEYSEHPVSVVFYTKEQFEQVSGQFVEGLSEDFKAGLKQTVLVYGGQHGLPVLSKRVLLVGLGEAAKLKPNSLRLATHEAVSKVRELKLKSAVFAVPELPAPLGSDLPHVASLIAGSIVLSDYHFDRHFTKPESKPHHIDQVVLVVDAALDNSQVDAVKSAVNRAVDLSTCVLYTRNIANERGDDSNPQFFEDRANDLSKKFTSINVKVFDYAKLLELGCGLICAVGQAAESLPRIIFLEYRGAGENDPFVAVVGKGITFDTGGLNLKPTGFIEEMYMDKHGASTTIGIVRAAAALKLNVNLVCVLALAENAIDAKSYKPLAILKSLKGLTVEVGNTDAEGRLALADAMTLVQREYKVDTMLDIATLTGACVVALGEYAAGLFTSDDELAHELTKSGVHTHERVWRLPLWEEYRDELKGKESDLKSMGKGRMGGASVAAAFLWNFVDDNVKWAHLDIAGTGMTSEQRGPVYKGGSGFGVQLVAEFLANRK